MDHTVKDMFDRPVVTDEGRARIRELFYEPETWRLRYAIVDMGGMFSTDEVLVSTDRFDVLTDEGWPLGMTREELDAAPRLEHEPEATTWLPSLVVGPFGYTFSPLMMVTAMAGEGRPAAPRTADDDTPDDLMRDGSGRVFHLEKVSDLLGRAAFDPSGDLGEIVDLTVEDDMILTEAVCEGGARVALERLRRRAEQGHLLFN